MNIYVGNLSKSINETTVREAFATFGEVGEIKLIKDRFTNELRGFGFVEMPSKKQGQEAIDKLNGSVLEGRNIIVNEAQKRRNNNRGRHGHGFRR
jgi:RNA recognition motif-containing protein